MSALRDVLKTDSFVTKKLAAMRSSHGRFFIYLAFALVLGCDTNKDQIANTTYEGPIRFIVNQNTLLTDSGKAVMRIKSPRRQDLKNGDQEWEEGLNLEIYKKNGDLETEFSADYVIYTRSEDLYKGVGNVVVKNYESDDELNTEELFWDPSNQLFYTEKFVSIISEDEVHTGNGLTADENFNSYTIHEPSGTLTLSEEP